MHITDCYIRMFYDVIVLLEYIDRFYDMQPLHIKGQCAQPYKCKKLYPHVIILGPIKSRDNQRVMFLSQEG